MRKEFTIDLHKVTTKKDVMLRFGKTLELENFYGNSWDAFDDDIRSLNTQSKIIRESPEKVTEVFLKVTGINDVHKISPKDFSLLLEILAEATDSKERGDDINFLFQVSHD